MWSKDGYLRPIVLQVVGLVLLVIFAVLYYLVRAESALLIGAALALIGVGSASGAIVTVQQIIRQQEREHEEERDEHDRSGRPDRRNPRHVGGYD